MTPLHTDVSVLDFDEFIRFFFAPPRLAFPEVGSLTSRLPSATLYALAGRNFIER